jgi:hypothetical protein
MGFVILLLPWVPALQTNKHQYVKHIADLGGTIDERVVTAFPPTPLSFFGRINGVLLCVTWVGSFGVVSKRKKAKAKQQTEYRSEIPF